LPMALVLLLVAAGCNEPSTPAAKLTDVEKEYADRLAHAYGAASSVPMDVDEIVGQNIDPALSGEQDNSNIVGTLQEANLVLSEVASILREPTPYTMDSLAETNESVAAILETAYLPCVDVVLKETEGRTAAWGGSAVGDLLGLHGVVEGSEPSVAAKARILACVGSEGKKVRDAVDLGLGALRAKEEEIKSGRAQEPEDECFIATAAYGSASAAQLDVLRDFRDEVLLQSAAGRDYVDFYYAASPPLAEYIAEREWLRTLVRELLVDPIVAACQATNGFWSNS